MRNFDPSFLYILFGVLFIAGMFDMPFIIWGLVGYFIYTRVKARRNRQDQQDSRDPRNRRRGWPGRNTRSQQRYEDERRAEEIRRRRQEQARKTTKAKPVARRNNPFKTSGMNKFKEYDYEGAIEDFQKALEINNNDVAVHFNIACTYSLTENKEKAFYHLSQAVQKGFKDIEKIKTHDALAYIRIQDEFEEFERNGFRQTASTPHNVTQKVNENSTLLEQLNQLSALREKGLLTEAEFQVQKKKLLG